MTRRQNRSCDQCRKAKRACDAPVLADLDAAAGCNALSADIIDGSSLGSLVGTCSYCARTGKRCTFHWVVAQAKHRQPKSSALSARAHGRKRPHPAQKGAGPAQPGPGSLGDTATPPELQNFVPSPPPTSAWHGVAASLGYGSPPDSTPAPKAPGQGNGEDQRSASGDSMTMVGCEDWSPPIGDSLAIQSPYGASSDMMVVRHPNSHSPFGAYSDIGVSPHADDLLPGASPHGPWAGSLPSPDAFQQPLAVVGTPGEMHPWMGMPGHAPFISPFSMDFKLAEKFNSDVVSGNLMKIYHDVFEGALSCWLTEQTCPYKMQPKAITAGRAPAANGNGTTRNGQGGYEHMVQEWGPSWSNRIYRRVMKLDKVAQACGVTKLTKSQDRAATRAFHLVIMAFASQWAHNSQRSQAKYSSPGGVSAESHSPGFDRTVQLSFWNQARSALQDCAELDSFRIACAEIIFGLAQRPVINEEELFHADTDAALAAMVGRVLELDGPPIFLERASRKIHAMKFRFEAEDARVDGKSGNASGTATASEGPGLDTEDRRTIGLLYWLSVMFDTCSSAMNQRPVVIPDTECTTDLEEPDNIDSPGGQPSRPPKEGIIWRDYFTKASNSSQLRWPCSYDQAAEGLAKATPVKVLLYRHVTYIQSILVRQPSPEVVESSIQNAFSVYKHWNLTYAPFFRDCIDNYETLPHRIQSWFAILLGHWHLAVLLLADLIEVLDEQDLGIPQEKKTRSEANVVRRLRKGTAMGLSDLSRVATPPDDGTHSFIELDEFHSAVNKGPLLTEPWTIMLIRAFSKAGLFLLEETRNFKREMDLAESHGLAGATPQNQASLAELAKRCEACVKALWYLGKKSDMAQKLAGVLGDALARVTGHSAPKPPSEPKPRDHQFMMPGMQAGVNVNLYANMGTPWA